MEQLSKVRGKLFISMLLGILVWVLIAIIGDLNKTLDALKQFQWWVLIPILLCTFTNYVIRFLRQHYYLKVVGGGAEKITPLESAIVSFGSMSMAVTPGKLGEVLKSFLIQRLNGTPIMVTAPIVVAERFNDGLAMLVLSCTGFFVFDNDIFRLAILLVFLGSLTLFLLVQWRWLANKLLMALGRIGFLSKRIHHLQTFYDSSYRLFKPQVLVIALLMSIVGWFGECFAFYLIMLGLGQKADFDLLLACVFIMAAASLAGTLSFLPGGLGVADGSIGGLLALLVKGVTGGVAAAATFLIRLCTLWFGVLLGIAILFIFRERFQKPQNKQNESPETPSALEAL